MKAIGFWLAALLLLPAIVRAEIGLGSTREEVLRALGTPKGTMTLGKREALTYDGGVVEIEQNRVVYIDPQFKEKALRANNARQFEIEQKAKGLVYYDGRWMKPAEQTALEEKKRKVQDAIDAKRLEQERIEAAKLEQVRKSTRVYSEEGQTVDIKSLLVPGDITLIDFYADWCGPCKRLAPYLASLVANNPGISLCKIDIVDWNSPIARQYNINSIPNVWVFDRNGRQIGQPTGDFAKIAQYVSEVY